MRPRSYFYVILISVALIFSGPMAGGEVAAAAVYQGDLDFDGDVDGVDLAQAFLGATCDEECTHALFESFGRIAVFGIAAAGAPIIGTVNLRDAQGHIVTSAIHGDGAYAVDVTSLTPPFVIWAEGHANNKSVRLYTTIDDAGRVNITPATHAILALALEADPELYFSDPTAQPPASEDVAPAQAALENLLSTILVFLEVPGFDLMNGEFTTDGEGFDALLETLDLAVADGNFTVINEFTQSILYNQALVDGIVPMALTDEQIAEVTGSIEDLGQIRNIYETFAGLYADADNLPTLEMLQSELLLLMDDDYLSNGCDKNQILARRVDPNDEMYIGVGLKVLGLDVHRPMVAHRFGTVESPTILYEMGENNYAGVWVTFSIISSDDRIIYVTDGFVQKEQGGPWRWYGERKPFLNSSPVEVRAYWKPDSPGPNEFRSGLDFWAHDEGNVALDKFGINGLIIFNPALPEILGPNGSFNGIVLMRPSPEVTEYQIIAPSGFDGMNISAVTDNEFLCVGYTVVVNDGNATFQPVHVWIKMLAAKPVDAAVLAANPLNYFTRLDTVAGKTPDDDFTGADFYNTLVDLSWTSPVNDPIEIYLRDVTLGLKNADNAEILLEKTNPNPLVDWSSTSIDTSEAAALGEPAAAFVNFVVKDQFDRRFESHWSLNIIE